MKTMNLLAGLATFASLQAFGNPVKTYRPVYMADSILVYSTNDIELKTNEQVEFLIPEKYHGRQLDFASMTHRQDPDEENECVPTTPGRDCLPGYTDLEFLASNGWRHWGGVGSGPKNSKFAELRRGQGETDNLYEWRRKGHVGEDEDLSKDPLFFTRVRAVSLGEDSIHLNRVIIKYLPPKPTITDDFDFSEGFKMGDYETTAGRVYPGNPSLGDYGTALAVSRHNAPVHAKIPADWKLAPGKLLIPLVPGRRLSFVDVAVGDMRKVPAGGDAENYRGGARVNITRIEGGRQAETMMKGENVGTNGVMRATPASHDKVTAAGDFIEIEIPRGLAQIMGIRVGYH